MDDDFRSDGATGGNRRCGGRSRGGVFVFEGGNSYIFGTLLRLRRDKRCSPPRVTGQAGK
jgi:hypothetical protein